MGSLILSDLYACASATVYSYQRTLYSQTPLKRTPKWLTKVSVLTGCPY